jgi:hypothetical protein
MQGIEIPIGAPLGQLDKDLNNAQKALKGFTVDANGDLLSIGKSLSVLERQLKVFKDGIKNSTDPGRILVLNNAIKATEGQLLTARNAINGVGFNKFSSGSNQAAFALTNLGRVAQDAPFGFIGIQNNLNPLLESFQQLKKETGSTGGAIKALGQSLIGPAGLGIALSVVSAGILFYQQYQQRANKEVTTAKKVTDEYINSLNQIDQARLKGGQNAQAELTTLKLLYDQYQNATLPIEKRKDAYAEIQKLYPAYFGNLAFEASATDKTKTAYNGLTESILASARARAAADLITKNSTRQLENEQKVIDLTTQITKEQTKQKQLQATVESQNLLAKQEANILTSKQRDILNQYLQAGYQENELTKLKNNLLTDSNLLTEKNIQLQKSATAETLKGGKISGAVGGDKINAPKKAKENENFRGDQVAVKSSINSLDLFAQKYKATAALLNTTPLVPFPGIKEKLDIVSKQFIEWNTSISNIINGGLVQTFAGIGEAIGNSLATGTSLAQNLGNVLLSTLGSVLGQLGQMAIATGVALLGIQTALKTLNPFVAIAAGVALLALSGVVRGAASKLGGGMGGGGGGNYSAPIPQASSTISTSAAGSSQDFGGGRVVFEISGTTLIGVLNRAGAKLQRFGP